MKHNFVHLELVRNHNLLSIQIGRNEFLHTVFDGEDGVYYDAVADEIFAAKRVGFGPLRVEGQTVIAPVFELTFANKTMRGVLQDHGLNEYLGAL